jgi:hypothetical protein
MATDPASGAVSNVVSMTPQPVAGDVRGDISNTMEARDRLQTLISNLTVQRKLDLDAFLQKFAADLVRVPGVPDKSFVDKEVALFTTWETSDLEAGKRIDIFTRIAQGLDQRIAAFERFNRDAAIDVLKVRIQVLQTQRQVEELDERALAMRLEALKRELARLLRRSEEAEESVAAPAKKAAKRRARKRAAKRPAAQKSATRRRGRKTP